MTMPQSPEQTAPNETINEPVEPLITTNVPIPVKKHVKKSKKHSKQDGKGSDTVRTKQKKHKRSHSTITPVTTDAQPIVTTADPPVNVQPIVDQQCSKDEPPKKKKKHSKDSSKHKKNSTSTNTAPSQPKTERTIEAVITKAASPSIETKQLIVEQTPPPQVIPECASPEGSIVPISPETQLRSRSQSFESCHHHVSQPTSRSPAVSRASSLSFDQSPSHNSSSTRKQQQQHPVPQLDSSDRDRLPRTHHRESGESHERVHSRPDRGSLRTNNNRSRDVSLETNQRDRSIPRRRRSRSHGSPRRSNTQQAHASSTHRRPNRDRPIRSPSHSSQSRRRATSRSMTRSPSTKRDRNSTSRQVPKQSRVSTKTGSSSQFSDRRESYGHSSEERSRHVRGTRGGGGDQDYPVGSRQMERNVRTSQKSPTKHSVQSERHRSSKSSAVERSKSRSDDRQSGGAKRVKQTKERSPTSANRHTDENKSFNDATRRKLSASRSPKSSGRDRKRHSQLSSKVSTVLNLLQNLNTDPVSDDELTSILASDILSKCMSQSVGISAESGTTIESPAIKEEVVSTDKMEESEASQSNALDCLDRLSSKLREQLAEPEPWDTVALSPSDEEKESDNQEALLQEPELEEEKRKSLVELASVVTSSSYRAQMFASLTTHWQDLIESANRNTLGPSLIPESTDKPIIGIKPTVPMMNALCPVPSNMSLTPIEQRARGPQALYQSGISRHYLGSKLWNVLHSDASLVDTFQPGEVESNVSHVDPIQSAWLQRNRSTATAFLTSPSSRTRSTLPDAFQADVISASTDRTMRLFLLGAVSC